MADTSFDRGQVLQALERVLASAAFQGGGRSGALLRFLVERTLDGGGQLKEYTVGAEGLGRGASFDPRHDAIVRVEVSRLRARLTQYYATDGVAEPVRIVVPKGSYVPVFEMVAVAPPASPREVSPARTLAMATAAVVGLVIVSGLLWAVVSRRLGAEPPPAAMRFELDLGEQVLMRSTQVGSSSVIISPDGRRLVFVAFRNQEPRLLTRPLDRIDGADALELPGTAGVRGPFFSPDGRSVGFLANRHLWKVSLAGGQPTVICDAAELLGASWGDDGTIVAAVTATGLVRVSSDGGTPAPIPNTPVGARWPQLLPGSRALLFTAGMPAPGPLRVDVLSFADGTVRTLVEGVSYARYLRSGHLAWVARQTLFVAPFDLQRLQVSGPAVALVDDVAPSMYGGADFDVSDTGTLVFRRRPGGGRSTLHWIEPAGRGEAVLDRPEEYFLPRLSPDGTQLAFSLTDSPAVADFRILRRATGTVVKPVTAGIRGFGTWLPPDGRFLVGNGNAGEIRWMRTDGSEAAGTLVAVPGAVLLPWSFNPDGSRLAFHQRGTAPGGSATFDLWTVPVSIVDGALRAGTPQPFVASDAFESFPAFSPDGRFIAHVSLEEDAYEVYVRSFPDGAHKWRVSTSGGIAVAWSSDARRLFYETLDHRLMVVEYRVVDGEFQPVPPRPFSPVTLADTGVGPGFTMAPGGRVLGQLPAPGASPQGAGNVTVVLNVLAELQRRQR